MKSQQNLKQEVTMVSKISLVRVIFVATMKPKS